MVQKTSRPVATAEAVRFTVWEDIVESVAEAFRMDAAEKEWLHTKKVAKLIAAVPYLAGCEDPGRTAITHLGAYILGTRIKNVSSCQPSDSASLFKRLEMLGNFIGGDRKIIDRGMNLLALVMISDYAQDVEEDRLFGKFNPVSAGVIDYQAEKKRLLEAIDAVRCPEMDAIANSEEIVNGGW